MPARNAESTVGAAVASVLRARNISLELIVVDDYSSDRTLSVVKQVRDPRLKIVENSCPLGVAGSLNVGLSLAQGEFIGRLDSDDLAIPKRFERQKNFLQERADIGLVGSWAIEFGEKNRPIVTPTSHKALKLALLIYNPFVHSSVMFKKSVFEEIGARYSEDHQATEDYELWTRFALKTKVAILPQFLTLHRRHQQQVSTQNSSLQQKNARRIQEKYAASLGVAPVADENYASVVSWFKNTHSMLNSGSVLTVQDRFVLLKAVRRAHQY